MYNIQYTYILYIIYIYIIYNIHIYYIHIIKKLKIIDTTVYSFFLRFVYTIFESWYNYFALFRYFHLTQGLCVLHEFPHPHAPFTPLAYEAVHSPHQHVQAAHTSHKTSNHIPLSFYHACYEDSHRKPEAFWNRNELFPIDELVVFDIFLVSIPFKF